MSALFNGVPKITRAILGIDGELVAADPFAVLHGLYLLTANLSDIAPVLLVVDDAHWADGPSLRFVHYLGRRIRELPVLMVVAARTNEETSGSELVRRLPAALTLRLRPLSETSVQELAAGALGRPVDPRFARACARVTGGNPFLLSELLTVRAEHVGLD